MAAKLKVVQFQPPVPDEDEDDDGGTKCPPVGAPAWLATFADIATNLMAFFVLILGFAQFDEPSFKKFAGAMREQFGAVSIDGAPRGDTIINLDLKPSPGGAGSAEGAASGAATAPSTPDATARAVAKALGDALAQGEMAIQSDAGEVVVKLPPGAGAADARALAEALTAAVASQGVAQPGGPSPDAGGAAPGAPGGSAPAGDAGGGSATVRAEIAAHNLGTLLQDQIASGDVAVERKDGKIKLTVGSGGAFASGSADLTARANEIIARLEQTSARARRIVVTGHTDDVPVSGGAYADNWDLASARAQSVVRALEQSATLAGTELSVVSKGETQPVADNTTPEGREKNRRIEIEIEF